MPNENKNKIIKTLKKQNTMLDMVWYVLLYGTKSVIKQNADIIAEDAREKYGLNASGRESAEEGETYETCINRIKSSIAKDYTVANIGALYEAMGMAVAYNEVNAGKEVYDTMNELPDEKNEVGDRLSDAENKRIKEMKAMYLTYKGSPFSVFVLQADMGFRNTIYSFCENNGPDKVNEYEGHPMNTLENILLEEAGFDKNTTFAGLFDKYGVAPANRAPFINSVNGIENESVFSAFKRYYEEQNAKKAENKRENITDKMIMTRIKSAFMMFMEDYWIANGKNKVIKELSIKERQCQELGNKLQTYEQPKEIYDWVNSIGKDKAYEMSGKNIVKSIANVYKPLYSGKPLDIMKNGIITGAFNDTLPEDTTYVRLIISELEATGKGEGVFHKSNSDLYEKMLASIKRYEDAVETRNGGVALEYKKDMLKLCKKYISGKEKVRDSGFGKVRFNGIMALLSRELPEEEFKTIVDRVNVKRGFDPNMKVEDRPADQNVEIGDEPADANMEVKVRPADFISKKFYDEYFEDNLNPFARKEDKVNRVIQDAATLNRTSIPADLQKGINAIDNLYGKEPQRPAELKAEKFSDEALAKLKIYDEEFAPIGPHEENDVLSDKDFAAIAFAGALTPDAVRFGGKIVKQLSPEDNLKMTGDRYSTNLFDISNNSFNIGQFADAIQFGRGKAAEAMKAYVAGDKAYLAGVLVSGITHLVEVAKMYSVTNAQSNGVGEMARRMTEMLERDKELKKFALRDGLTEKDISYVKSINRMAEVYNASSKAYDTIKDAIKSGAWENEYQNPETRVDMIADMVMNDMVNASIRKCEEERNKNTSYVSEVQKESANIEDNWKFINDMKKKGFLTKVSEEIMQEKIDVANYRMVKAGIKYRVENSFIDSLSDKKEYEKIKNNVKGIVKDAGLHNLSAKDLKRKYSSGDILKKIAAYTSMKPKAPVPKKATAEPVIKMKDPKKPKVSAKK